MSQIVSMSITCIGEECKRCEELDLDVERTVYHDGINQFVDNFCFCKNYRQCERIMEHLRKNNNSDSEKDGV